MAGLNTTDLEKRQHPEYKAYAEHYALLAASYLGGQDYLDNAEEYIVQHPFEEDSMYEVRVKLAYYLNYCKRVVESYTNFIYKEGPRRSEDTQLSIWFDNVDGKGTSMNDFMKSVSSLSSVFGFVDILLDAPKKEKDAYTVADVSEGELLPYLSLYTPLEAIDWSTDYLGRFNWVLYKYRFYEDSDVTVARTTSKPYRVLYMDPKQWLRWSMQDETFKENGTNEIGCVPVVRCRNRMDSGTAGISLIGDIAYVNRAIFNWCSLLTEQIQRQTFSQLVIPDNGDFFNSELSGLDGDNIDPTTGEVKTNLFKRIGTSWAFTFPAESGQPPQYISPDNQQIDAIWQTICNHITEIFRMVGLSASESSDAGKGNGGSKQRQYLSVEAALSFKAGALEDAENRIIKNYCRQQGIEWQPAFATVYPRTFDVLGLLEELESSLALATACGSATLNTYVMKKLTGRLTKEAPPEIRAAIESEIDANAGSFVLETTKKLLKINGDMTVEDLTQAVSAELVAGGQVPLGDGAPSVEDKNTPPGESVKGAAARKEAGVKMQGAKGQGEGLVE